MQFKVMLRTISGKMSNIHQIDYMHLKQTFKANRWKWRQEAYPGPATQNSWVVLPVLQDRRSHRLLADSLLPGFQDRPHDKLLLITGSDSGISLHSAKAECRQNPLSYQNNNVTDYVFLVQINT